MTRRTVALSLAAAVWLAACDKSPDSGSLCSRFVKKARACGLLTEGRVNCSGWYMGEGDACVANCLLRASCEDLREYICWDTMSAQLWACFERCEEASLFTCADGTETIPLEWVCDGEEDCWDGSDEVGCTGFTCRDGSDVIPEAWVCDGEEDCWDGSDEIGCGGFSCRDGSGTVPDEWVCDGYPDCDDGSDEIGCAEIDCP